MDMERDVENLWGQLIPVRNQRMGMGLVNQEDHVRRLRLRSSAPHIHQMQEPRYSALDFLDYVSPRRERLKMFTKLTRIQ